MQTQFFNCFFKGDFYAVAILAGDKWFSLGFLDLLPLVFLM